MPPLLAAPSVLAHVWLVHIVAMIPQRPPVERRPAVQLLGNYGKCVCRSQLLQLTPPTGWECLHRYAAAAHRVSAALQPASLPLGVMLHHQDVVAWDFPSATTPGCPQCAGPCLAGPHCCCYDTPLSELLQFPSERGWVAGCVATAAGRGL